MSTSRKIRAELKSVVSNMTELVLKFNTHHDPSTGQFASGSGGGAAGPDTGTQIGGGGGSGGVARSPGGKESYNDRIEGTQKEADREVRRAAKKVKTCREKLNKALSANKDVKVLTKKLTEVRSVISDLQAKQEASKNRIAELKARLESLRKKKSKEEDTEESLEKKFKEEFILVSKILDGFKMVNKSLDKLIKEIDSL